MLVLYSQAAHCCFAPYQAQPLCMRLWVKAMVAQAMACVQGVKAQTLLLLAGLAEWLLEWCTEAV